jgi:predicted permease
MRRVIADIRFALRILHRQPLFTTLTTLSIALGIGANIAIFTLLDQVVLRPLPVAAPAQLVQLQIEGAFSGNTWGDGSEMSYPMYQDIRDRNEVFSGVCARFNWAMHLSGGGATERVNGELVSGTYFPVLGVGPAHGRVIAPADDRVPGGHAVAVLSFDYWNSRFNADPRIVGQKILLNGQPFAIVGVSVRGFQGIDIGYATQVFVPMMMKAQLTPGWNFLDDRRSRFAQVFARLRPGVTADRAQAALQPFFRAMRAEEIKDPSFATASPYAKREFMSASLRVVPAARGHSGLRDFVTRPLWTLMAIVAGVLLIACANVAGLLIARGMARQREIAIRMALGGGRLRVVQQLLVESVVLSVIGAAGGLLLATWGTSILLGFFIDDASAAGTLSGSPDARIIGFTMGLALVTALVCGLVPALQATTPSLAPTLKDQAATVVSGGPVRLRKALVVAQVALSLLLLIGAGLFVRSLQNLLAQHPGFETSNLVAFMVDPSLNGYPPDRIKRLASNLVEGLRAIPGVTDVSVASVPVLSGGSWNSSVTVEGYAAREGESVVAYNNTVMPGYFRTMRIPLLFGRDFSQRDARWMPDKEGDPDYRVAIANQRFVQKYFRGRNPIGRHVGFGGNPGTATPFEIIGVVGTAHYVGIRDEAEPQLFFPLLEDRTPRTLSVYVRTSSRPETLFGSVRTAVRALDQSLPIYELRTMDEQVNQSLRTERLVAHLSTVLSVLATLLAVIGLYGVVAYTVARRTREVGIRMTLGAQTMSVVWLFVREAAILVGFGCLLGLPALWAFGQWVRSQLFGIDPMDPFTIAVAAVGLAAVALTGAMVPALRASRINPLQALRVE